MGLFKGLAPRLCSSAIGTVVHSKVLQVPARAGSRARGIAGTGGSVAGTGGHRDPLAPCAVLALR